MRVARVITPTRENLESLCSHLRRAGYSVEFAAPGEPVGEADLVITAEALSADQVVPAAAEAASALQADVMIAPGVVPAPEWHLPEEPAREDHPQSAQPEIAPSSELAPDNAGEGAAPGPSAFAEALHDVGSALKDGGRGIKESVGDYRERVAETITQMRERREMLAEARRLERERRELEQEDRRRHERLLEQQRLEAEARARREHERMRAEQEAERERLRAQREAERQAAVEAERVRLTRETERIRAERDRLAREREAALVSQRQSAAADAVLAAGPSAPTPLVADTYRESAYVPRRVTSARQGRLQRATFAASIVALIMMLGLAVALNFRPESPVPNGLVQNPSEQQVPFGPAHINAKPAAPAQRAAAKPPLPKKNSPAVQRPVQKRRSALRRSAADRDVVADDEVVVHQFRPTRQQTAQSRGSDGVRRISDQ